MTEGVEVHQAQANSASVETDPGSEEPDQQEEDSSTILEVQHHSTGGAEDISGGPVAPDGGWGWVVVAGYRSGLSNDSGFPFLHRDILHRLAEQLPSQQHWNIMGASHHDGSAACRR